MQKSLQLSPSEVKMMEEVFQVFNKYAHKTREFGLQVVHSHFPIQDDEILYETHDKKKRVLTVVPASINQFKKMPTATAWQKTSDGKIKIAMFCCDGDSGSGEGTVIKPLKKIRK